MYNNSEPYGRSDPKNMLTQVNMQMTHSNNNAINFIISGKPNRELRESSDSQHDNFSEQAYGQCGQVAMGFDAPTSPFSSQRSDSSEDSSPRTMHAGLNFVSVDLPKFDMEEPEIQSERQSCESDVEVKLEPSSWVDTEYQEPFSRDVHAVSCDHVLASSVVRSDVSVRAATDCVTTHTESTSYFECPTCAAYIRHAKRFLIHVKWHSFGLTHAKRMQEVKELQDARASRRRVRSERRLQTVLVAASAVGSAPCKDCDHVFVNKQALKKHRSKVHPVKMTQCKVCLAPVRGLAGFRAHMASHVSKVRVCMFSFPDRVHPVKMTQCKVCLAPVRGLAGFRAHMASHVSKENGDESHRYQCPECPKKYKFSHSLYKHIDTHLEKTHKCPECSKLFGSAAQLARHLKSHEKVARGASVHCAYCGKGYYDTFTLQIHERIHTNERPFACDICNTAFQTNSSLKRHTRISHNSSSAHVCTTCRRAFNSARVLQRHERRAHAAPDTFQHPCSMCDKRYFKSKDLRNHMYKIHKKGVRDILSETE